MNEKINVELTKSKADRMRQLVQAGEYRNVDEILSEAVTEWLARHEGDDTALLKRLWDEGIASGQANSVDLDSLRIEARNRLKAQTRGC